MKRLLVFFLILLMVMGLGGIIFTGCGLWEEVSEDVAVAPDVELMEHEPMRAEEDVADFAGEINAVENEDAEAGIEEKIIKEGWVEYITGDVEAKVDEVEQIVEEYEGHIQESFFRKINDREKARLKIKIESNLFESVYGALGEIEDLVEIESTTEDITMEYVDLQRRLEVYEAQEERYLEMLEEAENIEEMLEVEGELERIRLEIESYEGRLNYFDSITDYSYIDVTVEEKKAVAAAQTPDNVWEEFAFSLSEGWQFFSAVVVSIVSAIIWGLPFIIIIGILIFVLIKIRKRSTAKE